MADQSVQNGFARGSVGSTPGRLPLEELLKVVFLGDFALGDGDVPDRRNNPVQRLAGKGSGQQDCGGRQPDDQKLCPILKKYCTCDSWRTSTPLGTATW